MATWPVFILVLPLLGCMSFIYWSILQLQRDIEDSCMALGEAILGTFVRVGHELYTGPFSLGLLTPGKRFPLLSSKVGLERASYVFWRRQFLRQEISWFFFIRLLGTVWGAVAHCIEMQAHFHRAGWEVGQGKLPEGSASGNGRKKATIPERKVHPMSRVCRPFTAYLD